MEMFKFGETALGLPIHGYRFKAAASGTNKAHVLVIGGVHGDEPEGVVASRALLEIFRAKFDLDMNLTLIPEFNPEGVLLKSSNQRLVSGRGDEALSSWPISFK
jgi:murein peptide amidase A